jgi:predicted amidohydrolase YtcJ
VTETADLVVTGRIATLGGDDPESFGWAEAVAVRGSRVVAAGTRAAVDGLVGPSTRRLDLADDEVAMPGITDSHLHLAETALAATRVDLHAAATLDEGLERIRVGHGALADPDAWLEGAGWDNDRWGRWPTAADLEGVAPGRKVALWAHDHHSLWVSSAALAAAGVTVSTPDPAGGVIRRAVDGSPAGVLNEAAARLVTAHIPLAGPETVREAVARLTPELLRLGIVAVHDPGGLSLDPSLDRVLAAYRALAAEGTLAIRVHACLRPEQLSNAIDAGLRSGQPLGRDPLDRLRLGWLKCFADGTLGSRTAALLEPLDLPDEPPPPNDGFGVWMTEPAELAALANHAVEAGIATIIHAIGDAAVRTSLDILGPTVGRTPLVPRLEHVQLVSDSDLGRFASLGVAASVQPVHVRSDAEKARSIWGPRAEARGYPFGRLARGGALVSFGTDAPVEPIDPWPGIACAITRAAPDWPAGTAPFGPDDAMSLPRALRSACVVPALTAGERDRGRLVAGHRADVVILPKAALSEPVAVGGALWHARPTRVLMDGEVVFEA